MSNPDQKNVEAFANRMVALGFTVYVAERGTYGMLTDDSRSRALGFESKLGDTALHGVYGPPSRSLGSGWRLPQNGAQLKTAEHVRTALYANAPAWAGKGRCAYLTADEYLERVSASRMTLWRKPYTLAITADAMREHDRHHAPGSESAQWQAFCDEARRCYGVDPFNDEANETIVSHSFAAYWLGVAECDYDTAEQYGDVPDEWRSA